MSSKSKWAYLAGLIDSQLGELPTKWIKVSGSRPLAKWLVQQFGGIFRAASWNDCAWEIVQSEKILLGILPYVIIKRRAVQSALDVIRQGKSQETNTPDALSQVGTKIESDLLGNGESDPVVTQAIQ